MALRQFMGEPAKEGGPGAIPPAFAGVTEPEGVSALRVTPPFAKSKGSALAHYKPPSAQKDSFSFAKKEAQEKCFLVPREGGFPFATPVSPTARVASKMQPKTEKGDQSMTIRTREQWLISLADILREDFYKAGLPLPERIKVSCGWPSCGARNKKSRIVAGECWSTLLSRGGNTEIFISPIIEDSLTAAHILVHELVHAAVGVDKGHGSTFKRLALHVGLTGPMRATTAGPELAKRLNTLIDDLGAYPHESLKTLDNGRKKQGTRLKKVVCPVCSYTVRITSKWIDAGLPVCPCGTHMEVEAESV